jgi:hypothetical protein
LKLCYRFAYTDFALARALSTHHSFDDIDINISYDSACSYSVNVQDRFKTHIPHLTELIGRARFSIDSLHVNDHIDKCMYLFSTSYQDCVGHFHGVGTEQYWSENNQMGPQTRQMNPGYRHDKIIEHHSDWNWKKTTRHGNIH